MSAEVRKRPEEWCRINRLFILDPDGWRGRDGRSWDDEITEPEFRGRFQRCTVRYDETARAYLDRERATLPAPTQADVDQQDDHGATGGRYGGGSL